MSHGLNARLSVSKTKKVVDAANASLVKTVVLVHQESITAIRAITLTEKTEKMFATKNVKAMEYIVKHNIPTISFKKEVIYHAKGKDAALFRFHQLEKYCLRIGYPVKSFVRDSQNKPLRATLQVEVDNFMYYAELYAL